MYRDTTGWTIHRKRAWTALMNGCHYDYIDFSITVGNEAGTRASRQEIRTWMQHLSEFMNSLDFVHSQPDTTWISGAAKNLVVSGLSIGAREYVAYLADGRELSDTSAGDPFEGSVGLSLPPGDYDVSLYSPVTGAESPAVVIKGGGRNPLNLPSFRQDIVIRAKRRE
jgi:hypothetical protein